MVRLASLGDQIVGNFGRKNQLAVLFELLEVKENFLILLILKEKYEIHYFTLAKSTEEDDRQILSIEAQLVELKEFAAKEKLEIVASLCEAKTAKEPGRMKFAEMLSFIETRKSRRNISVASGSFSSKFR